MKPEIIILMDKGFTNKQIIEKLGVKAALVYYYRKKYDEAKEKVDNILKEV